MEERAEYNAGLVVSLSIAYTFNECRFAFKNNDARTWYINLRGLNIVLFPYMDDGQIKECNELIDKIMPEMESINNFNANNSGKPSMISATLAQSAERLERILRVVWKKSGLMARHEIIDDDYAT